MVYISIEHCGFYYFTLHYSSKLDTERVQLFLKMLHSLWNNLRNVKNGSDKKEERENISVLQSRKMLQVLLNLAKHLEWV